MFFDLVGVYITFEGVLVPSSAALKKKNGSFIFSAGLHVTPGVPHEKKKVPKFTLSKVHITWVHLAP